MGDAPTSEDAVPYEGLLQLGAGLGWISPAGMQSARERIAASGPDGVSLDRVAEWAGVPREVMEGLLGLHRGLQAQTVRADALQTTNSIGAALQALFSRGTPETIPVGERVHSSQPTILGPTDTSLVETRRRQWPLGFPHQLGPYQLLEELGHGGMGTVFLARHGLLGTFCAVKVLLAGVFASAERIARFRREAAGVARMGKHPNIVAVHDLGEHGPIVYYAMELVEGRTLRERMRERLYTPAEAAVLVEKLAGALHFAHGHGIIHRDVKPENIVIRADGEPQLMDFGLARDIASDSRLSQTGEVMGTPVYMAPEQIRGDVGETDARTDVYAAGVVLYELLTGIVPHSGANLAEIQESIRRGSVVHPRRLRRDTPRGLETICLKCLQEEPARRYATAGDLAEDCRRLRAGEPILARRVSRIERAWGWCRRRPAAATACALGVLGAALGILLFALWWSVGERWQVAYQSEFTGATSMEDWTCLQGRLDREEGALCLRSVGGEAAIAVLRRSFFGDVRVTYEARVEKGSPVVSDLSCFMGGSMSAAPYVFESGYYFGVGGNLNTRSHLLRNSHVVAADWNFRLLRGHPYRVVVEKTGASMRVSVDGGKLYEYEDFSPLLENEGLIGFYVQGHCHLSRVTVETRTSALRVDEEAAGDAHFGKNEFLAAAIRYEGFAKRCPERERKDRCTFKRAVSLRGHSMANYGRRDDAYWREAREVFDALARSSPAPRVRLEARVAADVMRIDEGDVQSGAALLAQGFDDLDAGSRLVVLNAVVDKALAFRSAWDGAELETLLATFIAGIRHETLVEVGADNFRNVAEQWTAILAARGRWREAADLSIASTRRMRDAAAGAGEAWSFLSAAGAFDEALADVRAHRDNYLEVRKRQRPADDVPLERDPYWFLRWEAGARAELGVLLAAGRIEEARRLWEDVRGRWEALEEAGLEERAALDRGRLEWCAQIAEAAGDATEMRRVADDAVRLMKEQDANGWGNMPVTLLSLLECLGDETRVVDLLERGDGDASWTKWAAGAQADARWIPAWVAASSRERVQAHLLEARMRDRANPCFQYWVGDIAADEFERRYAPFAWDWPCERGGPWRVSLYLAIGYELRGDKKSAREQYERALSQMAWRVAPDWYLARHGIARLAR